MKLAEMFDKSPAAPPDLESSLGKILGAHYNRILQGLFESRGIVLATGMAYMWLNLINEHGIPEDLEAIIHGEGE